MATLDDVLSQLSQPGTAGLPSVAAGLSPLAQAPVSVQPSVQRAAAPAAPAALGAPQIQPTVPTGGEGTSLFTSMPDNISKLRNKWAELGPVAREQFDEDLIRSIIDYDTERVQTGGQPLTREQTVKALVSVRDNVQATPQPERNPLNVAGNAVGDLASIVKSIPRLPQAMLGEVSALTRFGEELQANKDQGMNPLQALANAPGIRLLPGSFIAGNLTDPAELARHPLFAALDVLPVGKQLAKGTKVGKAAMEAAELAGKEANPLSAVLTRGLDADGQLVRNKLGRGIEHVMTETKPGRTASQIWGRDSREMSRMLEEKGAHLQAMRDGIVAPADDIEQFMVRSAGLRGKYGFDDQKIVALTDRAQLGDFTSLAPDELAFLDEARELGNAYGRSRVDEGLLRQVDVDGTTEFYPKAQAEAITQAREVSASTRRITYAREEMLRPTGGMQLPDFRAGFEAASKAQSTRLGNLEAQALVRTMQSYGYDVSAFMGRGNRLSTTRSAADYARLFDETDWNTAARDQLIPVNEIVAQLKGAKQDVMADRLATALRDGNGQRVTTTLDSIMQRIEDGRPPVANDPRFAKSVRAARDIRRLDSDHLSRFTEKRVATFEKRAAKLVDKTEPARFGPLIAKETRARAGERLIPGGATAEQAAIITQAIGEARWGTVAAQVGREVDDVRNLYRGIEDEVAASWREMKQAGADPIFVHRVGRSRAGTVAAPRIGPVPGSISQDFERARDFSPGVDDVTVALTHQGMEILSRRASEQAIDQIVTRYGVREADLRESFASRARELAAADPSLNFEQALRDLLDRRFEVFNPDQRGYNWGGAKLDKYRQDQWLIPKPIADNLHKIASPKGAIASAMDPITNTFRLSVVGLSPRTQLYNILGGATMLLGQTSPTVSRFYGQARRWVKNPELIDNEVLAATIGSSKRSFESSEFARADASIKFAFGRTMSRFMDEHLGAAKTGVGGVKKAVDWMLDKNALVDDQYRVMAYLYGRDKAITRGLTEEVSRRSGETLMRKTMMDWTGMTPIERTVFKSIFPFYGFMSHSLRYVTKYPVDHPLRAQIVAAFAQSEEADLGAIPGNFLGMLAAGKPDENNRQTWLNTAALNPFGDVANMFTVAGFLSSTNPVLSTAFEQAGLTRGQAELYPTLRYDPETGRLAAKHVNPLQNLVENIVPQTAIVTSLLGVNAQYESMLARNPAAATRFLLSNSGIPITHRQYNMSAEIAKAEVARQRGEQLVKTAALESGDWDEAMRYPSLRPVFDQIDQLPPEVLQQFTTPDVDALREVTSGDAAGTTAAAPLAGAGGTRTAGTGGI